MFMKGFMWNILAGSFSWQKIVLLVASRMENKLRKFWLQNTIKLVPPCTGENMGSQRSPLSEDDIFRIPDAFGTSFWWNVWCDIIGPNWCQIRRKIRSRVCAETIVNYQAYQTLLQIWLISSLVPTLAHSELATLYCTLDCVQWVENFQWN